MNLENGKDVHVSIQNPEMYNVGGDIHDNQLDHEGATFRVG